MSHEDIFRARILASRYEQLKTLLETGGSLLCLGAVLLWANSLRRRHTSQPIFIHYIHPKSNHHMQNGARRAFRTKGAALYFDVFLHPPLTSSARDRCRWPL